MSHNQKKWWVNYKKRQQKCTKRQNIGLLKCYWNTTKFFIKRRLRTNTFWQRFKPNYLTPAQVIKRTYNASKNANKSQDLYGAIHSWQKDKLLSVKTCKRRNSTHRQKCQRESSSQSPLRSTQTNQFRNKQCFLKRKRR